MFTRHPLELPPPQWPTSPSAGRRGRKHPNVVWAAAILIGLSFGCGRSDPGGPTEAYLDLAADLPLAVLNAEIEGTTPLADPGSGALFLPSGTSVSYAFQLRSDSRISVERIELEGTEVGLVIEVETDAEGTTSLAQLHRAVDRPEWTVDGSEGTPIRLTLRVTGGDSEAKDHGVRLLSATVRTPVLATDSAPEVAIDPVPAAPTTLSEAASGDRPNIILYLIDTLRRDRLGCYGYARPQTPHLDAFAARATLFTDAIAQSTWTKASVASIFSGVWPPAHGATGWKHKLPAHYDTLAEVLQRNGYRTMATSTNPNVVKHYDMDQGFDEFITQLKTPSPEVNRTVFGWLDQHAAEEPFFVYIHTMDPHAPYGPPEPFRSRFAPNADQIPQWTPRWRWPDEALPFLDDLYDADIAFNDDSFGRLVADLEERGLYDESLIVVLSDHGEEFREHRRWRHGNNLFSPTLDVPLIIKYPGQSEGRRVTTTVQHLDLMPTVLEVVGLPVPAVATGRSLVSLSGPGTDPTWPAGGRIFSHLRLGRSPLVHSVIDEEYKLIRSEMPGERTFFLFHRPDDPRDERNLADSLPVRTAMMDAWVTEELLGSASDQPAEETVLDDKMKEDLKALGYLE